MRTGGRGGRRKEDERGTVEDIGEERRGGSK